MASNPATNTLYSSSLASCFLQHSPIYNLLISIITRLDLTQVGCMRLARLQEAAASNLLLTRDLEILPPEESPRSRYCRCSPWPPIPATNTLFLLTCLMLPPALAHPQPPDLNHHPIGPDSSRVLVFIPIAGDSHIQPPPHPRSGGPPARGVSPDSPTAAAPHGLQSRYQHPLPPPCLMLPPALAHPQPLDLNHHPIGHDSSRVPAFSPIAGGNRIQPPPHPRSGGPPARVVSPESLTAVAPHGLHGLQSLYQHPLPPHLPHSSSNTRPSTTS